MGNAMSPRQHQLHHVAISVAKVILLAETACCRVIVLVIFTQKEKSFSFNSYKNKACLIIQYTLKQFFLILLEGIGVRKICNFLSVGQSLILVFCQNLSSNHFKLHSLEDLLVCTKDQSNSNLCISLHQDTFKVAFIYTQNLQCLEILISTKHQSLQGYKKCVFTFSMFPFA